MGEGKGGEVSRSEKGGVIVERVGVVWCRGGASEEGRREEGGEGGEGKLEGKGGGGEGVGKTGRGSGTER